jgi:flagellar motor switch protein FliG
MSSEGEITEERRGRVQAGARKVAAALLGLDRDVAQLILRHFNQNELKLVARFAADMGPISSTHLEKIYEDLAREISTESVDIIGDQNNTEGLLAGVVPEEQLADIMSDLRGVSNQFFWRRIAELPEKLIAEYLVQVHPQISAIFMMRVDSAFAARVVSEWPSSRRTQIMRRFLSTRPVSEQVVRVIETGLREDLLTTAASGGSNELSTRVAGIINQLERDQVNEILAGIEETEPVIAAQLKSLIFSFEDIVRLDQRARLIIFDQVPTDRVILALRDTDATVRDAILPCLSARTRRMVEAELATGATPPKREIVAAQRQIADTVLRLSEQGLIDMSGAPDARDDA